MMRPKHATLSNHIISLSDDFGNTNIAGMQLKDNVIIDGTAHFVKLDDLRPDVNGVWENGFNNHYSSVSETITGTIAKHIKNAKNFDCVTYDFIKTNDGRTGTLSKNFLQPGEMEVALAYGNPTDRHFYEVGALTNIETFAEQIVDRPSKERFNNLIKLFENYGVTHEHAHDFLIQQAAFDIMVGNTDRLNNPSNFTTAHNINTGETRLVNMDYGRALPLDWFDTMEEKYNMDWLDEDIPENAQNFRHKDDSILSGLKRSDQIAFLKEEGFTGFDIDKEALTKELDTLKDLFEDTPFKNFATVKIESTKHLINNLSDDFLVTQDQQIDESQFEIPNQQKGAIYGL